VLASSSVLDGLIFLFGPMLAAVGACLGAFVHTRAGRWLALAATLPVAVWLGSVATRSTVPGEMMGIGLPYVACYLGALAVSASVRLRWWRRSHS